MSEIIKILEIIGTVAFAISGALVAIGANLDIFGVIFVGCITAVGGGIVRDLLLGITPPMIFSAYHIFLLALITAVTVFIIAYINKAKFNTFRTKIEHINNIFDAIGLAAFSVTGAEVGFTHGFSDNALIIIVLGMTTGIGGGIFRDILTDTTPYVFKKHIYALASIFGSAIYFALRHFITDIQTSSTIAMLSVVTIRLLATKYCWNLPRVNIENDEK